jgi:hypothetical protein
MTRPEQIGQLETMLGQRREQIVTLLERVRELEMQLAQDSHNSGETSSTNGLARKTRSLCKRSG